MSVRRPFPTRYQSRGPLCGGTPDSIGRMYDAIRCGLPRRHAQNDHVAYGDGWVWRWPAAKHRRIDRPRDGAR